MQQPSYQPLLFQDAIVNGVKLATDTIFFFFLGSYFVARMIEVTRGGSKI